jgi:hypothetical protein
MDRSVFLSWYMPQVIGGENHGNLEATFHSTVTLHLLLIVPLRLHPERHIFGKRCERNELAYTPLFRLRPDSFSHQENIAA